MSPGSHVKDQTLDVTKISRQDQNWQRTVEQFPDDTRRELISRISERIRELNKVTNLFEIIDGRKEDVHLPSKLDAQRRGGGRKRRLCFSFSFRVRHRRSNTGEVSLSTRSHVACVLSLRKIKEALSRS